jgi:hypothetical protein
MRFQSIEGAAATGTLSPRGIDLKIRSETGQGSGSGMEELLSAPRCTAGEKTSCCGCDHPGEVLAALQTATGHGGFAPGSERAGGQPSRLLADRYKGGILDYRQTLFGAAARPMTSSDADAEPGEATLCPSIYVQMTAGSGDRILVGRVTCFAGGDLRSQSGSPGQAAGESSVGL